MWLHTCCSVMRNSQGNMFYLRKYQVKHKIYLKDKIGIMFVLCFRVCPSQERLEGIFFKSDTKVHMDLEMN